MAPKKDTAPAAAGAEAAYARYLPKAQALADTAVVTYRLDPLLARHNVQRGLEALAPHLTALRKALPLLDWAALLELPLLAQAVVFAAAQVQGSARATGEIAALMNEAAELRRKLLGTADYLVLGGALKAAEIAKIRSGRGPVDQARDCIQLAALFRKQPAALSGQTLVKAADVARASELGTELLDRLQPRRARGSRQKDDPAKAAAVAARDRLATLLWLRHGDLRRAGYYQFGEALDEHVPPLQSGRSGRRKQPDADKDPAPAPA